MNVSAILLRWYKSFNINYLGYDDRQPNTTERPWNSLNAPSPSAYRFIEIPLRKDITTVVGANESGKSHLLSALNKVINGVGIPEGDGTASEFGVIDLCHYASIKDKNAKGWPNVGASFENVSETELDQLIKATSAKNVPRPCGNVTLILNQSREKSQEVAVIYFGLTNHIAVNLTADQLTDVRKALPAVEFIKSNVPLSSELPIDDLLNGAKGTEETYVKFDFAQQAARLIAAFSKGTDDKVDEKWAQEVNALRSQMNQKPVRKRQESLEAQLFNDVIGVEGPTLELLAGTKKEDRGFAGSLTGTWNLELDRQLNLRRFWQQDDQFSLSLDFKGSWFYFEIRDKTGAVYTFRERSSGLRYFLSYYIQAKSIEARYSGKPCVILMDEPDSFLSITGQKNLLAVFESLVSAGQTNANLQLIYTTHSPFLINPNYPHRIRLVKKGDSEEGSQFIPESRLRRYEPVRSALGINCAQTLFMGEANVLLEGPSDQFAITELIRMLTRVYNEPPILDLAAIIVTSAESASGVSKLLDSSQWGDERIPATVVLFDSDDEGRKQRKRVVGEIRGKDKLLDDEFVVLIGDGIEKDSAQLIVSTEDIFPARVYAMAVRKYIERWYPEEFALKSEQLKQALEDTTFGGYGVAVDTQNVFNEHVFERKRDYDKMGVFQIAIEEMEQSHFAGEEIIGLEIIKKRLTQLLVLLRRKLEQSKQESQTQSARQAIIRRSDDFFKRFKKSAEVFEVELHLERLEREIQFIGEHDSAMFKKLIGALIKEIRDLRASGAINITKDAWHRWSSLLYAIKKNPLAPEVHFDGDRVEPDHLWSPPMTEDTSVAVQHQELRSDAIGGESNEVPSDGDTDREVIGGEIGKAKAK